MFNFKRAFRSISNTLLLAYLTLAAAIFAGLLTAVPLFTQGPVGNLGGMPWYGYVFVSALLVILAAGFFIISLQTYSEYKRRTYDPTLILKYQEMFDGLHKERKEAARCLLEDKKLQDSEETRHKILKPLEDVLDFFEDLGFYWQAEQFSEEVIHHHFYHWIRLYWDSQAARNFVKKERSKEAARWEHINKLFEAVSKIEASKQKVNLEGLSLCQEKETEYLEEERDLDIKEAA